jgi:hypothetical protein
MQFVIIEMGSIAWQKEIRYHLELLVLMGIIPAVSMALFAGHIVDQSERKETCS